MFLAMLSWPISPAAAPGMGLRHYAWQLLRVPGSVTGSRDPPPGSTWAAPRPVSLENAVGLQFDFARKGHKKIEQHARL